MKKVLLSLLILTGTFTAVLAFHACSADDEAEEPQHSPQAQLLLQKSREFAKKYNVNMTLNEDNIEETAKTLSVEEMEKDYREISHLSIKSNFKTFNRSSKTSRNKLRIKRLPPLLEEDRPDTYSGSSSASASNDVLDISLDASASWTYSEKGKQIVTLTVDFRHKDCHDSKTKYYKPKFGTSGSTPTFSFSDNVTFKCEHYTVTAKVEINEREMSIEN